MSTNTETSTMQVDGANGRAATEALSAMSVPPSARPSGKNGAIGALAAPPPADNGQKLFVSPSFVGDPDVKPVPQEWLRPEPICGATRAPA